jgi:hypothetical protein
VTTEPQAERMPASVREWTDILARIRFGTVRIAGKNITGARIKAVAGRMASYADGNGTRVRPGIARIAVDLETDYGTARRAITCLRNLGLLDLVRSGGRRGADEFRLTLPVDLLDRDDLEVWSPSRHRLEVERVSGANRGFPEGPGGGPSGSGTQVPEGPVKALESQVPQGPVIQPPDGGTLVPQGPAKSDSGPSITGATGTAYLGVTGAAGTRSLVPQGPATHQDLDTRAPHHSGEDAPVTVTTPGAPGPATNPESPPLSNRCPHGLPGGLRGDGKPACALCRVGAPPTDQPSERLATVIQLHTREAS